MEKKICLICGEEFETEYKYKMFCSDKCQRASRRTLETDSEGYFIKYCKLCGKEYRVPMDKPTNGRKYCGDKCKKEAERMRSAEQRAREKIRNKKVSKDLEKAVKKAKGKNYGEFYAPEVRVIFPSWVVPTRRGVKNG